MEIDLGTVMRAFLYVFLLLFFWGLAAAANDGIEERAYFEDVAGELTFEELPQKDFTMFSGVLGKGYSKSVFWIRLHVDPKGSTELFTLRIRPSYLDEVVLFDPVFKSMGLAVTGDEISARDHYESLNLGLTIPAGESARDIWLRVRTKSTFLFSVEAFHLNDLVHEDQLQELKSAFYLSLVGLFIIWSALNWWATKDQVIAIFALKQTLCLVFMAGIMGYTRYFWPVSWTLSPGLFVDVLMGFYGAAAFWFEYRFLKGVLPNRHLLAILRWFPLFLPVYVSLVVLDLDQWAFKLCMILFLAAPILTFILALTAKSVTTPSEGQPAQFSRKILVSVYGLILFAMVSTTLPIMGWAFPGSMIFDGPLIYSLVSGFAILMLLQFQIKNRDLQRMALEIQHREVKKQVEIERMRREEQAQFLAMLTHELRTPMTAIRMSLSASDCDPALYSEADQSISEMADILDRCLISDQMERGKLKPHTSKFWLGVELRSLASRCADSSRVDIQIDEDFPINKDLVLFRMVIANLVDNALKYGERSSMIHIRVERDDDRLLIRVENAPGKAGWPDPEQLFQKYYRAPRAQGLSGTGLGLHLSRQLSQRLGGELRYTPSASHIGFTLCLPL